MPKVAGLRDCLVLSDRSPPPSIYTVQSVNTTQVNSRHVVPTSAIRAACPCAAAHVSCSTKSANIAGPTPKHLLNDSQFHKPQASLAADEDYCHCNYLGG